MKRILIIAVYTVLNLLSENGYAAGNPGDGLLKGILSGKITDAATGKELAGVSIYVSDARAGTISDGNGNYSIKNLPEGRHLVEVTHIGYTTLAEEVMVAGDTHKDFVLTISVTENNTVVVTGVSGATQLAKVPVSIAVIRKQDLLQNSSTNIIDALSKTPGVSMLSTGPAISKPFIRGLGYNRVLTINDGVRQEGNQWGDEHGIEIDELSVNKVEILRGPGSIIYGSDAMAGVVNIISNTPVAAGTIKGNLYGNYQANNRLNAWNANLAGNSKGFNWNVYGTIKNAGDYKNKYDGYVFNSKFNERNFGGYAGYNGSWGYSHLLISSFDQHLGIIEGERNNDGKFIKILPGGDEVVATDNDFKSTDPFVPGQRIRHFKISTDNSFTIGKSRLAINLGFQRNQRQEFGNPDDPKEVELAFDTKTITYTAQYHLPETKNWKITVGMNGMQQNQANPGLETLVPEYNLFDIGGYVYAKKTFSKKITLSAGARYDSRDLSSKQLRDGNDVKVPAFTRNFSNFSGSAGTTIELFKGLNLKINTARAYRAPTIPELASNGSHEGTLRYEYGAMNLKSETSFQSDLGVEYNSEHVSFSVSGFLNSFSNFIFYRKLQASGGGDSTVNVGGQELTAFTFDQRKASMNGFEAALDIHPHPLDWLHIENTFSLATGKLKEAIESSKYLPFVPAPRLINELRASFDKLNKVAHNFYLKLELDNTFAQKKIFTAYNTETATPGYSLLNAGAGTDIVSKKDNILFSIHIAANNLTDVAYQNHLSRLKYAPENLATGRSGVFNMGRNFSIKVNVPLNFTLRK